MLENGTWFLGHAIQIVVHVLRVEPCLCFLSEQSKQEVSLTRLSQSLRVICGLINGRPEAGVGTGDPREKWDWVQQLFCQFSPPSVSHLRLCTYIESASAKEEMGTFSQCIRTTLSISPHTAL